MNNDAILVLDIGSTKTIAIVAQNDFNNRINILGVGDCKSSGIKKGSIVDVDLASNCIGEAISSATQSTNSNISEIFVSVSSAHSKVIRSQGAIGLSGGSVGYKEVNHVLQTSTYNANIIPDYEVIHVLPFCFKVDDSGDIQNPLNMQGARLEAYTNIVTIKKTSIVHVKDILKKLNLCDDIKFVLSSHASSLSVLNSDQKRLGVVLLDLGGSVSELTFFKDNSIVYSSSLSIGSENITADLSTILETPYNAANMIKKQYGTLLPSGSYHASEGDNVISKVKIPILGNESEHKEIPIEQIRPIIHARVEELLCLMKDSIHNSGISDRINSGIAITGGLSQVDGLYRLASKIFDGPVKILNPKFVQNGYINFDNPTLSVVAGLLKYALDTELTFDLNSSKEMRFYKNDLIVDNKSANINIPKESMLDMSRLKDEKKSLWTRIGKWL